VFLFLVTYRWTITVDTTTWGWRPGACQGLKNCYTGQFSRVGTGSVPHLQTVSVQESPRKVPCIHKASAHCPDARLKSQTPSAGNGSSHL
jgi:hypothetical protein